MALQFNKIEPVRFGDFSATPKLNTSLKMRLQNIKFETKEEQAEAIDVIASCFGSDEDAVAKFIRDNLSRLDMQRIQAYLVGGDSMLDQFDNSIDKAVEKRMDKAMESVNG